MRKVRVHLLGNHQVLNVVVLFVRCQIIDDAPVLFHNGWYPVIEISPCKHGSDDAIHDRQFDFLAEVLKFF